MNYDCFVISRYVFLIFLVIVATYFIVENKQGKPRVETYEDAPKTSNAPATKPTAAAPAPVSVSSSTPALLGKEPKEIEAAVKQIYQELYKASPTPEELAFYLDYAKSRNITRTSLREVIETSAPTLKKTLRSKEAEEAMLDTVGTEQDVINAYQEILQRNPSREELFEFSRMLKNDKTFNEDKLKQVLLTSEEYKRLERTQSNLAFTNLNGDITDRQLSMIVYKLYKEVTGKDYLDEETLRFLKKKFVEFRLNEKAMRQFIASYVANKPFEYKVESTVVQSKTTNTSSPPATANAAGTSNALTKEQMEQIKKTLREELKKETEDETTKGSSQESFDEKAWDGKNYIRDSVIIFGERPNAGVLSSLQNKASRGDSVDGGKLVESIKKQSSCSYFKDTENSTLARSQQELANLIEDRNRSHMKNVCERNTMYLNADDDMVLFPEFKWEVPIRRPPVCVGGNQEVRPVVEQTALIGTLLADAQDTKVGSVLPLHPPV